jgi:hypothetical protein
MTDMMLGEPYYYYYHCNVAPFSSCSNRHIEKFKANNSSPRNSLNKFQPGRATNSALTSSPLFVHSDER